MIHIRFKKVTIFIFNFDDHHHKLKKKSIICENVSFSIFVLIVNRNN